MSWSEGEFEEWFMRGQVLPDGERVLVIGRQLPIRRVVDLLAIDSAGGLVIIEVKNERSTRAAVGQSLEYLAQYVDTEVEDLEDEYSLLRDATSLADDFRNTFNGELKVVAPRRRVYLVAPSFDVPSAVSVRYLQARLLVGHVEYHLVRASRVGDGFRVELFECPAFTHAKNFQTGSFAVTPSGRLNYVLASGSRPVVWRVGRRVDGHGLRLPSNREMRRRCIQAVSRMLIPAESAPEVDASQTGTVWQHPRKPGTTAKMLGRVRPGSAQSGEDGVAVIARFVDGAFEKFQRKSWRHFAAEWRRVETELPDWRETAEAAANLQSR